MLREDPSFAGTLGGFDRGRPSSASCSRCGFTEAEYFEIQTRMRRARQQLASALFADTARARRGGRAGQPLLGRHPHPRLFRRSTRPACRRSPSRPTRRCRPTSPSTRPSSARSETRTVDLLVLTPEALAAQKDDHRRGDRRRIRAHQGQPDPAGAPHHPPGRAARRRRPPPPSRPARPTAAPSTSSSPRPTCR